MTKEATKNQMTTVKTATTTATIKNKTTFTTTRRIATTGYSKA